MKDIAELPERDDIVKTFKDKLQKPSDKKESEKSEDAKAN